MWNLDLLMIASAIIADFCIGDPPKLPHVVRAIGFISKKTEDILWRNGKSGLLPGILFYGLVIGTAVGFTILLQAGMAALWKPLGWFTGGFFIFQSIAYRDLVRHVQRIYIPLKNGNTPLARQALSRVVGRDTEDLAETEIARASIETLAESLNDGVIAPLFWSLLLGPVGGILFRATNTLDSMVGHRNDRYEYFGKASARMDDVLGYLPARITAAMIWIISSRKHPGLMLHEASLHRSWNAGYAESAMAHALGIRLGGNNSYGGKTLTGPIFNENGRMPVTSDIERALKLAHNIHVISFIILCLIVWILF